MQTFNNNHALTIVYDYFSCQGGAARIARNIDAELCNNGWCVDVLTNDIPPRDFTGSGLRVYRYGAPNKRMHSLSIGKYLSMSIDLLSLAKSLYDKNNYSLVICHHYLTGLALLNFNLNNQVKTIFVCHGIRKNHFACYNHETSDSASGTLKGWDMGKEAAMTDAMHILEEKAINSASKVICVSTSVASEVVNYWPNIIPEVIQNFYCLPSPNQSLSLNPNHFSLGQDQSLILFAGRWERTKGCDVITEIARRMSQECDKYLFVHAGLITDTHYSSHVMHLGHLNDMELIDIYQKASLLLMPSRYEPFGLAAIEALWHGTPVLAHRVGGLEEIIEDGVNGWLMETLDPGQWCDKMSEILNDISDGKINSDRIKDVAIRRYDRVKSIKKYLDLFRRVISQ